MKKITKIILIALAVIMLFGTVESFAAEPFSTYTYSIDGEPLESPPAYSASDAYDAFKMDIASVLPDSQKDNKNLAKFNAPSDIVSDHLGNVYIADKMNNRIVILDKYYRAKAIISGFTDVNGKYQNLVQPEGMFVTNPSLMTDGSYKLYICDGDEAIGRRILIFDAENLEYTETINRPETNLLDSSNYIPRAIAVDIYGRIFITSSACYDGVIVLSSEGDFSGFIGVQKVNYTFIELIWRNFQSKEQRQSAVMKNPIPYNNITVDEEGFVYVTVNSGANTGADDFEKKQYASIRNPSAADSAIQKLNSAGDEILKRNGFFDPAGEVAILDSKKVSQITDIAIGAEGAWTILDSSRSRLFTYDQSGNLLYAFGGIGEQTGNSGEMLAITYQEVDGKKQLLVLDKDSRSNNNYRIIVYSPTPYNDKIMSALRNSNEHNYSQAINYWQDVLTQNNNFDLAYIGIGKALFNQGKYEEAQQMLEKAYETTYYDKAFMEIRKEIIQKWLLLLLIAVIVLIVLVLKIFGYAKKKNKVTTLKVGRKTYWEELIYVFHLIFHPFDAFWDLKHEQRGSVRASLTIMGITVLAFFYQAIGQGYSFNPKGDYSTVFIQVIAVILPVALWCVGNWCLTTLFDGEGSFKDIVIATGYSLAPLPVFVIISTILTNFMTTSEGSMVSLLVTIGYVWVGLLLFFGMLVTHGYTMYKNLVTVLGTILAMAIIIFIIVLFGALVAKMVSFVLAIFTEVGNRI